MIFECKKCNYTTSRKYNLELHNKSKGHLNRIEVNTLNEVNTYIIWNKKIQKVNNEFHSKASFPRHKYEFKSSLALICDYHF
jgi:hypothetical protein